MIPELQEITLLVLNSPTRHIPRRLNRLDAYLRHAESRCASVRIRCEKKIIWHERRMIRRPLSIVYLHGFSASRMEVWPLCDQLAAALGANLFYTRLTGHGQDGMALGAASVDDWLEDGLEAIAIGGLIGERIILMGTSTGGTLATWLAAQPDLSPLIQRLILLSPNFGPKNPVSVAALWPPAYRLYRFLFGNWRTLRTISRQHAGYWTNPYPISAIVSMMQLVKKAWQVKLSGATMPVLMLLNPWDRVINIVLAIIRFLAFPAAGKKLVFFRGNRDPGRTFWPARCFHQRPPPPYYGLHWIF
ncbi:alpha/beta hydrolase [Desulfosarcina cetonica]|uniref:alpha/beta hydrolase n=1 Tax=Desulfosarcina cetonica TaxID=90730 RepID=UPI0012ECCFC5|nr:alpha/beta fold hydrolase [Desulfosarcina cetonica]